jgi:acetylornithine deacetylase/succinyl-diaminopimelate desuccinylase-like protein
VIMKVRMFNVAAGMLLAATSVQAQGSSSPWTIAAPAPAGFDRAIAQRATVEHLTRLIGLDTQNPPGNEMLTARYFDEIFSKIPNVERHVLDAGNGRANFIARLRATNPTGKPVLVMGHMDVVGIDSSKWQTPAFTATLSSDGQYLYGRGAIDDKGMLAAATVAIEQLAKRRDLLQRDIIFLATAAEEGGGAVGIQRVIEQHFDLIKDAEFALNEGGRVRIADGRIISVNIQTTEKVSYNIVATAKGPSGHASVPLPDNVNAALARAVSRVHEWKAPVKLNEITRIYFERLATIEKDPERQRAMLQVANSASTPAALNAAAALLSRDPLLNAVLRTGQSLTLLDGGIRSNVIPSEATATFNTRVLPNDDVREVVAAMNRVGAEPQVTFALSGAVKVAPPVSPVTTALYKSMERSALDMSPTTTVIPFMSTGGTDGAALRARGIPTYGILPMPLPMEDELRMHGDNERVPVPSLGWAAEFIYRTLSGVAITGSTPPREK